MKKILVVSIGLVFITAGIVFAECKNGNTSITVVNAAKKAIELCVPDNAVSGIEEGLENSGGEVITAICPCFSQDFVDPTLNVSCTIDEGYTYDTYQPCRWLECSTSDGVFWIGAMDGLNNESCYFPDNPILSVDLGFSTYCYSEPPYEINFNISEEEAKACTAILETFLQ